MHTLDSPPQQIEVEYLSTLLEGRSPDPLSAHRVLDSLLEDKLRLRVCESVLQQRMKEDATGTVDHVETTIFVLHYIVSKLGRIVEETQRLKYVNWLLGAKVSAGVCVCVCVVCVCVCVCVCDVCVCDGVMCVCDGVMCVCAGAVEPASGGETGLQGPRGRCHSHGRATSHQQEGKKQPEI